MEILRFLCWGFTALMLFMTYKFYDLGLDPYASSTTGEIIFCLICAVIGLVVSIKVESVARFYRKDEKEAERKKKSTLQQYKDDTWDFPVADFYDYCIKNGIQHLNNSFFVEKAKLLALTILKEEEIPVPEEYHHRYLDTKRLKEYFQKGKEQVEKEIAIEKHNDEIWNSTPHKATPNTAEAYQLELAQKVASQLGIGKRQLMLRYSIAKLDDEIRMKKEGQEAIRQVGFLMSSSAAQQKKSDWAILGGIAEGIAGPAAGVAVAMDAIQKNAEIEKWNQQNRAAVNRVAIDIANSANNLNSTISEMEMAKLLLSRELSALEQKVVLTEHETAELWKKLKIRTDSVIKSETNVLEITTTIENVYIPDVPEHVRITMDGVLSAKVYFKDTFVGTAIIPLPLYGVECRATATFTSLCEDYIGLDGKYKVIYEPIALWAMEL